MTMTAPRDLLADVAVHVQTGTGIRTVVDRAPVEWRTDGAAYVTVTLVTPVAPDLAGDGTTLVDAAAVQVSLWETRDDETPARTVALAGTLDAVALDGRPMYGRVSSVVRMTDPGTDLIQHATTVRYPLPR